MGTGVGEAALAAELAGAGAATGAGLGAAGIAEAGLLGGEVAGGLGAAGAGLGAAGANLGATAGGLGSLAPAFQTAVGQTAAVMPEVAAQVSQAAGAGAMPAANAVLGAGQIGDPALAQLTQAFQSAPTSAQLAAQYGPGTQLAMAPGVGSDAVMGEALSKGPGGLYDLGATDMSLGAAGEANAAAAATPSASQAAGAAFDPTTMSTVNQGAGDIAAGQKGFSNPFSALKSWYDKQDDLTKGVVKYGGMGLGALGAAKYLNKNPSVAAAEKYDGPLSKFRYDPSTYTPYTYKPYAAGGPVEAMSNQNSIGANTGYPQADIQHGAYATPWQTPMSRNVVADAGDVGVDQMTGMERMANGGIANLGSYSDGGRLLKGPGDGMSDNIPANISGKQPARLADGEFVVSADVVSGLGNGSTEAGAKKLYKMMDRVRQARTGTKKQGREIQAAKYLPT